MQIGNGHFYHGDCLEVMRGLPVASVDMVVSSPPYDNLRTYNDMPPFTFETFQPIARELARLIKPGGVIVWNVGDATVKGSETGSSFRQALYFKDECGLNLHDTMIWAKPTFSAVGALQTRYAPVFEYMFVFCKGRLATFNPIKDRINKSAGQTRKTSIRDVDGKMKPNKDAIIKDYGQRFNIWEIGTVSQKGDNAHPAPFPVPIAHDHIISWSNPGDTVLDPFMGSGTTAIAAERSGRKWIGIERDEGYYNAALARIWTECAA